MTRSRRGGRPRAGIPANMQAGSERRGTIGPTGPMRPIGPGESCVAWNATTGTTWRLQQPHKVRNDELCILSHTANRHTADNDEAMGRHMQQPCVTRCALSACLARVLRLALRSTAVDCSLTTSGHGNDVGVLGRAIGLGCYSLAYQLYHGSLSASCKSTACSSSSSRSDGGSGSSSG